MDRTPRAGDLIEIDEYKGLILADPILSDNTNPATAHGNSVLIYWLRLNTIYDYWHLVSEYKSWTLLAEFDHD